MNEITRLQDKLKLFEETYNVLKDDYIERLKEKIKESIYNFNLDLDLISNEYIGIPLMIVESELTSEYNTDNYRDYLKNLQVKILERVFKES